MLGRGFYKKLWRGDLKASYNLDGRFQVDFKVVPKKSWPFALLHFTGSKEENIRLRAISNRKGYKLNEYGFNDNTFNIKTEKEIYEFLNQIYKEPQNR